MLRHTIARTLYALARDRTPGLRGRKRLAHTAARWLGRRGPVVVSAYGLLFEVDLRDHVEEQIFWEDYDRATVAWWRDQMTPQSVVFDVGANVGLYSLAAAQAGAAVFAFEPNPRTRARLEANIARNHLTGRVRSRSEALCDVVGNATLYDDVNEGIHGANAGVASLSSRNAGGRAMPVATSTIDSMITEHGLDRLDWIKMDIQGAELAALQASGNALERLRPKLVLEIEANASANMGWTEPDLSALLDRYGYKLRRLDGMNVVAEPS